MNGVVFKNISKIIERDSKTTTYKFALLRGVIDIIQDNSPFIQIDIDEGRVHFPLGLLIEKWLLYYYPIFESPSNIPQINGNTQLAFAKQLVNIIEYYKVNGGFSAFYNDLKNNGIPWYIQNDFFELSKSLRKTITSMPMKYIGNSINKDNYSIFKFNITELKNKPNVDLTYLINKSGTFSIPIEYFEAFKVLGSFINGKDSILFKWAEFSVSASRDNLSVHQVLNEVLKNPITERNIAESKKLYQEIIQNEGQVKCVWTGKKIPKFDIDHLIPFSVWRNNDLWNLLPSDSKINNQKRNKIPSPTLIEKQQDLILEYWEKIFKVQEKRFQKEIKLALLGNQPIGNWKSDGIAQLIKSCNYLIETRGFEEWNGKK